MKRIIIIKLLLVVASFCFSQTDGNFTNLDVRNRSTFRGPHYIYDSTYFKPYSVNVPLLATGQPLGWFLTTTKGAEAKLVRVTIGNLADSLGPFMPQYWTYVDAATDTLYNNSPPEDSLGVVLFKHPIELMPTTAMTGMIKQGGSTILHTYTDNLPTPNIFIGKDVGNYTMSGNWNYSLGFTSLTKNTTGLSNYAFGPFTLNENTTGGYNVATGYYSLEANTEGNYNIGIGVYTLSTNVKGSGSTALGYQAMRYANSSSSAFTTYNTAIGYEAMKGSTTAANNTGQYNTAVGYLALAAMTSGYRNAALGNNALSGVNSGYSNVGIGDGAGGAITSGHGNTAVGAYSLSSVKTYAYNTAVGYQAGTNLKVSSNNVAVGALALGNSADGTPIITSSVALGFGALKYDSLGSGNVAIGYFAGDSLVTGNGNVFIGNESGGKLITESNKLYIENSNSATPLIYGDFAADSLVINGDLTVTGNILYTDTHWDDLTTAAEAAKLGVNNKPVFNYDSLALKWDDADSTTNYIVANFQMKHTYAPGTDIYPHIHYIQSSTADTVEWFIMDYKWVDVGEARPGAFTRIHTNDQTVFPYTSGSIHQIAEFPAIDGTGHTESSILECRIYCWADGEIYTKELDIHFQINKPGTYNEYP